MRTSVSATIAALSLSLVAACGGSSSGTSSAATTTTTPATSTTSATTQPATATTTSEASPTLAAATIVDVPGYTYEDLPSEVMDPLTAVLAPMQSLFGGISMKMISKSGTQVGMLMVFELGEAAKSNPNAESQALPAMMKGLAGSGAKVTKVKLSGQEVAVATAPASTIVGWYRKGQLIMVVADTKAPAVAFAKLYLAHS